MTAPDATIEQLWPVRPGAARVSDDDLLALYSAAAPGSAAAVPGVVAAMAAAVPVPTGATSHAPRVRDPWLRVNFVATVDGSATASGASGALGGPADLRVFDLLRRLADVVLVAAGTVRAEGYGAMRVHDADVAWRRERGLPDHPVFAILSGSLALDPDSGTFADAPVRPIVLTAATAPADRRAALSGVADVIDCGAEAVDVRAARQALVDRGLARIHCEGGPTLLGELIAADAVDELCLTLSPLLEGGAGMRIARGQAGAGAADLRPLRLAHVLRSGDLLLTRYLRARREPIA